MGFEVGNTFGRRFRPGQSGNPAGRPSRRRQVDAMLEMIDENPELRRVISKVWLARILAGDYPFFREYLERSDGKVTASRSDA